MDESYEWDSAYIPMHPVDPKVPGLQSQEKIGTTKDYSKPYLDLKQKGKRNACSVYCNSSKMSYCSEIYLQVYWETCSFTVAWWFIVIVKSV